MTINLKSAKLMLIALAMTAAPAGAAFAAGAPPATGHFVIGGLLPPNGNGQGEPQAANSLPPGFMRGTPAMKHRDSIVAYRAGKVTQPN